MKKWIFIDLLILILLGTLSLAFAPDIFSLVIVGIMLAVIIFAFAKGIWIPFSMADSFRIGVKYISKVCEITSANKWVTFRQTPHIFQNQFLDSLWTEYVERTEQEIKDDLICSDLESNINEDVLALHCYKPVILQIPGTLTALGLIGTFLGLILGISNIAFSSVDAALTSITTLLSGIEMAFYTSIIGVILSMIFNISFKLSWNAMLREMGVFMNEYHKNIIPDEDKQTKHKQHTDFEKIIECLERIPKSEYIYNPLNPGTNLAEASNENALMTEIWEGLRNNDFTFYIQPYYDINTNEIIGGEALMRWNHRKLGIISPAVFMPTLEKNGFIVKLDCHMWEMVCNQIHTWLEKNIRPVPVSVNVSKMDLLVMDVPTFFCEMTAKYQVPPQYIQIEISENAYTQSAEVANEAETKLRQNGFTVIVNGARGKFDTIELINDSKADAIKIDCQYIEDSKDNGINDIVEQARKTRIKLIASSIETARQLTMLRKAGFTEGQGFFLHKPVDVNSFEELLVSRK